MILTHCIQFLLYLHLLCCTSCSALPHCTIRSRPRQVRTHSPYNSFVISSHSSTSAFASSFFILSFFTQTSSSGSRSTILHLPSVFSIFLFITVRPRGLGLAPQPLHILQFQLTGFHMNFITFTSYLISL